MQMNEAVSLRLKELLAKQNMSCYQLVTRTGLPKSTISNIVNCKFDSVKLRIIHEICQGLDIDVCDFFQSPLFKSIK